MTTQHPEPADPCREALADTLRNLRAWSCTGAQDDDTISTIAKAEAALATPNPLPELVETIQALLGTLEECADDAKELPDYIAARAALAKWRALSKCRARRILERKREGCQHYDADYRLVEDEHGEEHPVCAKCGEPINP